jgi:hypothetical protein
MSRRHLLPPRSTSKHMLTSKECGNSHLTLGCIRGGSLGLWGSKYSQNLECRDYKYFAHLGWCATIYFILPNRILYLTQFRKFEKLPLPVVWPGYPSVHMSWRDNGDTQHASEDQRFYGHNSRDCFPPPGLSWSTGIWYHRSVWQFVMGCIRGVLNQTRCVM